MQDLPLKYSTDRNILIYLFMAAFGCGVTALIWLFWSFELKWALFSILGFVFPFILVMIRDARRFLMGLLIFSIPLNADYNFFIHPSMGGADSISLGLTDILLLVLFIAWLFHVTRLKKGGEIRFFPNMSIPTLALIFLSVISMFVARDLLWSSFDIINFIKVFLFYFYLVNNIRNRSDLSVVLYALFLGLIAQTIIVAVQFFTGPQLGLLGLGEARRLLSFEMEAANLARPGGTIGHCNHLARYIGLLLPVSIVLSLTGETKFQRIFAGITSLTGLVALIYTLTRSSWIGLICSIIVMLFLVFKSRLLNMRTMSKISFAAVVFLLIIAAFGNVIWGRITTYDRGSTRTRWTTAKVAWDIIKDHPIMGIGINNYGAVIEEYWDSMDSFTRKSAVHNTYLLFWVELGIFGFGIFLWILFAFFQRIKRALHSHSRYYRIISIGLMGSLVGYLVAALGDKSYKENFTLLMIFWALAAVIEAVNRLNDESEDIYYCLLENENKEWTQRKFPVLSEERYIYEN